MENIGLTMDIYNFGLYGTFEPNGIDILGKYNGETVLILGNKYPGELGSTSILECLDNVEIAKALAAGTTIFVCDVEKSRMAEMKERIANVVHGSTVPTIDGFVDKYGLIRCIQARKDNARYILTTKTSQTKFADNLLQKLQKQFTSRRFAVSKHNESKISVRESLDVYANMSIIFDDANTKQMQYSFISTLPFMTRISLLWSCFTASSLETVTENLALSIVHDVTLEQNYQQSRLAKEFLSFKGHLLDSTSVDFIAMILSAISQAQENRSRSKRFEIQRFIEKHYAPETMKTLTLRLRNSRKMSLKDIRRKIGSACGFDEREYYSRVLHSSAIGSEIRDVTPPRRLDEYDNRRNNFEAVFANHLDELLNFRDSSLTRYSPVNAKLI